MMGLAFCLALLVLLNMMHVVDTGLVGGAILLLMMGVEYAAGFEAGKTGKYP